jgi:hypothetical protein
MSLAHYRPSDPKAQPVFPIEVEGNLRDKYQLTLPKVIVDALGAHPGDRFVFAMDEGDVDVVHLYRVRESYAGALAGVYGTPEEVKSYLRGEREAWEE